MSAETVPVDYATVAEFWREQAQTYMTQAAVNARTIATQKADYGCAIDRAFAQQREITRRIEASAALDLLPEWIVTGDSKRPTLWHLITDAYVEWSGISDADRDDLRKRISALRLSYLTPGGPRITLECFRCGASKASDECCVDHRLTEVMDDRCSACARMVAEGIGR